MHTQPYPTNPGSKTNKTEDQNTCKYNHCKTKMWPWYRKINSGQMEGVKPYTK